MTEPTRPILTIKRRNRTVYVPPEKATKSEPQPAERTTSKAEGTAKSESPAEARTEAHSGKAEKDARAGRRGDPQTGGERPPPAGHRDRQQVQKGAGQPGDQSIPERALA